MKYIAWVSLIIMFAASINTVFSEKVSLKEGEFAPDFSLEDQDGKIHSLSAYKGQRVIYTFFHTLILLAELRKLAGSVIFTKNLSKIISL